MSEQPHSTNYPRRAIGLALCFSPLILLFCSIFVALAGSGRRPFAAIGFIVAALFFAVLNFHLSFVRPWWLRRRGSLEAIPHVSGLPVVGTILVLLGGALPVFHTAATGPEKHKYESVIAPDFLSAITMNVIGYTNQSGILLARVRLNNKGRVPVSYQSPVPTLGAIGFIPCGWTKSQTTTGWTDGKLGPFASSTFVLPGSSSVCFTVVLPLSTLRWKFGFSVRQSSVGERTYLSAVKSGPSTRFGFAQRWLLLLLPSKTQPEQQFESDLFELAVPEHNESPEPTGAALRVLEGQDRFAAPRLRWCALSGAIGSAPRWAKSPEQIGA